MPSGSNAATTLGEVALAQLAMRLLDYDQLSARDLTALYPSGRHLRLQQVGLRHANALVDLVAVAENFATKRLLELHPEVSEYQVSTWEKRRQAWKSSADIELRDLTPNWRKLIGFVEARNAFQHGLGRLTDMQLSAARRGDVLACLAAANITLIGDTIRIGSRDVRACHGICEEFVLALDNEARTPL